MHSTINSFVNRAYTHCSNQDDRNTVLNRISKLLLNNGYKMSHIDRIIKQKEQHNTNNTNNNNNNGPNNIIIYYKNTMSSTYKTDKKINEKNH